MTKVLTKDITKEFKKSMKKTFSNTSIRAIAISLLFIFSGIGASVLINPASATPNSAAPSAATPVAAAPLTQAEANWEFPNGNAFDQDYNPQTQINSSNVQYLGLAWIFPVPTAPTQLSSLVNGFSGVGIGMSILIVNGTAFATTAFDTTIAFNVANGNVLWTFLSPLQVNQTKGEATGPLPLHSHDGNEWFSTATFGSGVSGPTLWFQGMNNLVYAINAINGKQELNFSDFTGLNMVAGNNPQSIYNGIGASNIVINPQLGILVSGHDAEIDADNGRGFFAGWNLNTNPPSMKWITYDTPPQPGSPTAALNPYFDQQLIANISQNAGTFYPGLNGSTNDYTTPTEVQGGTLYNTNDNIVVNWKTMPAAQLNATLYNDWGQSDQSAQCLAIDGGGSTGSTGSAWGGAWVVGSGQSAGMVFLGTNNKDPFVGPCNPGPDLWSASVIALNITTGAWIWAFQTTTHDIWDYDCSWWQGLANATIAGVQTEVLLKTCKDGYLFEFNAQTGNLIWAFDPPSGTQTPGSSRCPICFPFNPLNKSMVDADFPTALTNCAPTWTIACETGPQPAFLQWPPQLAGFESEQAIDQATGMIYATGHIVPDYEGYFGLNASTYFSSTGESGVPCPNCGQLYSNATTWAINFNTGQLVWHYVQTTSQGYRGETEVSGNVVYTEYSSGDIHMVDATTGQLLRDYYIGAPMANGMSIGAAVNGQEYLITPVGSCSPEAVATCPGTTPGDVVALTLQNVPTSTTTATATVTTTSTTTTTSLTTTTLPGQVTTTTVTGPGGQIITTTITGSATTVTMSAGATTVTTTTSSGSNNTALYGVAVVAVIFIIATGYLAMRGRKPAS